MSIKSTWIIPVEFTKKTPSTKTINQGLECGKSCGTCGWFEPYIGLISDYDNRHKFATDRGYCNHSPNPVEKLPEYRPSCSLWENCLEE